MEMNPYELGFLRILENPYLTKPERVEKRGVKTARFPTAWERFWHGKPSVELVPIYEIVQVPDIDAVYKIGDDTVVMHPVIAAKIREMLKYRKESWNEQYMLKPAGPEPCSRHGVVHCGYGVCRKLRGLS